MMASIMTVTRCFVSENWLRLRVVTSRTRLAGCTGETVLGAAGDA